MDTITKSKFKAFFKKSQGAKLVSVFVALVVVIGGYFLVHSLASGFFASSEAEQANLVGNAKVIDDTSASGGKAIEFGAVVTPPPVDPGPTTPPPSTNGYPAAYNTGYPHGLPGDTRTPVTLTPYTGPCTITAANTVIDSKDITCRIEVRAAGLVIKNSRIRTANTQQVYINNNYHALIKDTELDGMRLDNSAGGVSNIGDGSFTLIRVNVHSSGDGARINWGGVAIIDSYFHDPYCIQDSCHNDNMQNNGGSCDSDTGTVGGIIGRVPDTSDTYDGNYCIKIVHNRIEMPPTQNANVFLKADQDSIHDVMVGNNLLSGGGYTVYWYDNQNGQGHTATKGIFRDNRFRRSPTGGFWPKGGYYGTHAINAAQNPTWINNVWDDTGAQIAL